MPVEPGWDQSALLIRALARDESLTRGLGDIEARMLVEWATGWAELLTQSASDAEHARQLVSRVRRRAGTVGQFVRLWCDPRTRPAACQLAAAERATWPLPPGRMDPADLMHAVLTWEQPEPTCKWGDFHSPGQK